MGSLFVLVADVVKLAIRAETLLALVLALALLALMRGGQRAGRRLVAVALTAFLIIGIFPVGEPLLTPLERQYAPASDIAEIEGIILLGGSEDMGPAERWRRPLVNASGDRYLTALELAVRFPEARVLVTGGGTVDLFAGKGDLAEGNLAEALLRAVGLPRQRLIVESESRNTAENAQFSRDLLGGDVSGRWVLVTSAFHMPRAVASFCAAGWRGLVPWPTDYRTRKFWDGVGWDLSGHLDALNIGIKEWVGLLAYRLTGRLDDFRRGSCLAADTVSAPPSRAGRD